MVAQCDAILSYDHYPHDDIFRTGQKSARLLHSAVSGDIQLGMSVCKTRMMQVASAVPVCTIQCRAGILTVQTVRVCIIISMYHYIYGCY
jgi:microcystin degradation protein MlrC